MVKSTGTYTGGLNCQLTHGPSGQQIETDAPKDNHGRGAAFSPTDLTTASFAACMVTTMAIAARTKLGFDIPGVKWEVTKDAATKGADNVKVGDKVTIAYRMIATDIEAKPAQKK